MERIMDMIRGPHMPSRPRLSKWPRMIAVRECGIHWTSSKAVHGYCAPGTSAKPKRSAAAARRRSAACTRSIRSATQDAGGDEYSTAPPCSSETCPPSGSRTPTRVP